MNAVVIKVENKYCITIKRNYPFAGMHKLNPVKWLFPDVIEESATLQLSKIEGKVNTRTVLMRTESESEYKKIDYGGEIEFNDKNEMIIKIKDLEYSNLEKWNGNYYISRK